MTETLKTPDLPILDRTDGTGPVDRFRNFDLLDHIGVHLGRYAGVAPPVRVERAPRIDKAFLWQVAGRVIRDPGKRRAFLAFVAAVAVFTAAVFALLSTGVLGAVYQAIWSRYPGRPWTHVMRDHPTLYLTIAVPLGFVPFALAPDVRWGRAFLTYVFFLLGFLGGHVFW